MVALPMDLLLGNAYLFDKVRGPVFVRVNVTRGWHLLHPQMLGCLRGLLEIKQTVSQLALRSYLKSTDENKVTWLVTVAKKRRCSQALVLVLTIRPVEIVSGNLQ